MWMTEGTAKLDFKKKTKTGLYAISNSIDLIIIMVLEVTGSTYI